MKRIIKSRIFAFILGAIIFGSIGVYASSYLASDISFTPKNTNWKKEDGTDITNVKDAIDNLYNNLYDFNNFTTNFNVSNGTNIKRTTSINVDKGTYLILANIEQGGSMSEITSSSSTDHKLNLQYSNGECKKLDGKHIRSAATSQFGGQYLWNNLWYTLFYCNFTSQDTVTISNFQTGSYTETISSVSLNSIKIRK